MKKKLFNFIIVISYIYCLGYILFDFPSNTLITRVATGIMSAIFSSSLLYFLLKFFDKKAKTYSDENIEGLK